MFDRGVNVLSHTKNNNNPKKDNLNVFVPTKGRPWDKRFYRR